MQAHFFGRIAAQIDRFKTPLTKSGNRPAAAGAAPPQPEPGNRPASNRPAWYRPGWYRLAQAPPQPAGERCCSQAPPCRERPLQSPIRYDDDGGGGNHSRHGTVGRHGTRHGTLDPDGRTSHLPLPRPPALLSVSCSCFSPVSVVIDKGYGNLDREI